MMLFPESQHALEVLTYLRQKRSSLTGVVDSEAFCTQLTDIINQLEAYIQKWCQLVVESQFWIDVAKRDLDASVRRQQQCE